MITGVSAGCSQEPEFQHHDNNDQLAKMASVLGTDELFADVTEYSIIIGSHIDAIMAVRKKKPFEEFIISKSNNPMSDKGLDLFPQLFFCGHVIRITLRE